MQEEDCEIELKPLVKRGRPKKIAVTPAPVPQVEPLIIEDEPGDEPEPEPEISSPPHVKPKRKQSDKQIENFKKMLEAKQASDLKREQLKAAAEAKTQELLKKKETKLLAKQQKDAKLQTKEQKMKNLELMALSDSDNESEKVVLKKKKKKVIYVDSDGEEEEIQNKPIVIINKFDKPTSTKPVAKEDTKNKIVFL